jgi:D-glycero-alpha-D-manno-heptose-7-phosphate kinase
MGTYSAGTVALIRAALEFGVEIMSTEEIAELACNIEIQGMRKPIGKQNAYATALGGLNYFEFDSDGVRQVPLQMADTVRHEFETRLMLFFTGRSQRTSDGLAEYKRSMERNRASVVSALHDIKSAATELRRSLERGDLDDVGGLLDQGWSASRQLGRGIGDAWMEQWYEMARSAGADGGGTAGFGGTGFLFLYCLPDRQRKVEEALDTAGLKRVDFRLADEGVALILDEQTPRPIFTHDVPLVGVRSTRAQH